jgi:glycosyltransferase involved in cell wall biosynthesis
MPENNSNQLLTSITHFSSYLPKRCGIATYTSALIKTVENRFFDLKNSVVAIEDRNEGYKYPQIVKFHFWDKDEKKYQEAAKFINDSETQIVDIQHEFGLYGTKVNPDTIGENDGKNFLLFLKNLKKPSVTTLHMVYKNPPPHHVKVVREICNKTNHVVVLAEIAKKFLVKKYQIDTDKISVIPHGAPNVPKYSTPFFKEMLGFSRDSFVISSFGLVRPKKGYEYLIEAMPEIIKEYPNALLLIIGERHPQRSPEYYENLKLLVKKLKLKKNVKFINKFLDYSDLLNFLMATNVFVAPYLVMDQVSSGTLIYAMGCGRACISTPFDYAKEALANKRGILIPTRDSKAIANKIKYLIKHPFSRHKMEKLSYSYARKQTWSKTAKNYISLFEDVLKKPDILWSNE